MRFFYYVEEGSERERWIIGSALSLAGFVVFFDQLSKFFVVELLKMHARNPVIPGFFDITYITNTGAAWGKFSGHGSLLLAISVAVFVLVTCFMKQICEGWTERYYALMLVLAGIMGNSLDRVFRGAVVDFLRFHYHDRWQWPSFNIADMAITVGVVFFIISMLFRPEQSKKTPTAKSDKDADRGDLPRKTE